MWDAVLWIYLINATLLITHEIDSAYWREWEMFRLPGGVNAFLVIHLPLVLIVLLGLVLVVKGKDLFTAKEKGPSLSVLVLFLSMFSGLTLERCVEALVHGLG